MYFFRILSRVSLTKPWLFSGSRFSSQQTVRLEHLKKRTLLKLSGPDTLNYLQGMITNDTKHIEHSPALYALLLNAQGRVLYDIILYKYTDNEYLVEYDSTAVEYLHKHLLMYRLRKNVIIQPLTNLIVWTLYKQSNNNLTPIDDPNPILDSLSKTSGVLCSIMDPRNSNLGIRVITEKDTDLSKSIDCNLDLGDSYRLLRYKMGIGEGVTDHPPGNCLPFETNVDLMNGVSFTKGCYIGQELTARAHFVLNVRKRLVPVELKSMDSYPIFPPECHIVNESNITIGRLRSCSGQYGLGLLKYEEAFKSKLKLKGFDITLTAIKPQWWPQDIDSSDEKNNIPCKDS